MSRREALIQLIEETVFWLPNVEGLIEDITTPSLAGRITPLSHSILNMVGLSQFDLGDVESRIQEVVNFFTDNNKVFSWCVGPSSCPGNLSEVLLRKNFCKSWSMAGMALTDFSKIRENPRINIRRAVWEDAKALTMLVSAGFPLPYEVAKIEVDACLDVIKRGVFDVRIYLALDSSSQPVAYGTSVLFPEKGVVLLAGAATLEGHRGQGMYSSLVFKRLQDAYSEGIHTAIIQADRTSSAPICEKLGFTELCNLDFYEFPREHFS